MPRARECDYDHIAPHTRGGGRIRVRIQCRACHGHAEFSISGGQETVTQETADRAFRRRGWLIGRSRHHDICPSCQRRSPKLDPRAEVRASNVVAESAAARKSTATP